MSLGESMALPCSSLLLVWRRWQISRVFAGVEVSAPPSQILASFIQIGCLPVGNMRVRQCEILPDFNGRSIWGIPNWKNVTNALSSHVKCLPC